MTSVSSRLLLTTQAFMELTTCFSTGFKCEEHENPADFFLDVTNLCEKVDKDWEKQGGQRCTIVGIPPVYFVSAISYLLA